jgi:hypothetical protein
MSFKGFVYYLGLDLGGAADYSALAIVEESVWADPSGWASPSDLPPDYLDHILGRARQRGRPPNPPLSVRHLERFEPGTSYPRIVDRVGELIHTPPLAGKPAILLVDKTGVGAGVIEHFERRYSYRDIGYPTPITIHGGSEITMDLEHSGLRVLKLDLVSSVQLLLQTSRLKVAASLPEAETLRRELLNFRVKIDPKTASDTYSHWREGMHDDLVLATAMACWYREWKNGLMEIHYANKQRAEIEARS